MGGYVLEKFLIKKKVARKTPIFFIDFRKMTEDLLKKQNHRGSAAQIFFTPLVEKPLKNVSTCTPKYLPFTAKTGHFRQSCKGKSRIRVA